MSPLTLVLIGVTVFVILGAVGALKFGEWLDRRTRRRTKRIEAGAEPEDAW